MSQEIIYTSAPRGLKPNSSGFCTVLSTNGMASNLSQRLEALSGYRFLFQAHEEKAHANPVNYSHLKMTVGGVPFHVLSRICDAGLDHTKRSNKLAHHVAFKAREISPSAGGSPAWTMASPGFCETQWEGEPRRVAEGRKKLPDVPRSSRPCLAWGEVTGDPGWAGVLAKSALAHPPQPMNVIFAPGTDTLPLVVEALHLLPPEKRWDVTFSTYFTKLEAGTDCLWRFIIEGTPEAAAIRRDPHKPKIDLCAQLGPPADDELVDAARSGKAPQWSTPAPQTRRQPVRTAGTAVREEPLIAVEPRTPRPVDAPRIADRPTTLAYLEPERRIRLPWIIAGSLLLFLLITGGMIAAFVAGRITHELPMTSVADNTHQNEAASPAPPELDTDWLDAEEKPTPEELPPPPDSEPVDEAPPAVELAIADPVEEPPIETPEELPLPLADVILLERLPLPETKQNKGLSGPGPSGLAEAARLAEIYVDDVQSVDLRLEGEEFVLPTGIKFSIDEGVSPDKSLKTWKISQTDPKGIGMAMPIGRFRLQNRQLSFEWEPRLKSAKLKYCTLVIDAENATGPQTARCALFDPIEQDPLKLNFKPTVHTTELNIDPNSLPDGQHLRMKIQVSGWDASQVDVSPDTLKLAHNDESDEKSTIRFRNPESDGTPNDWLVHVEVRVVQRFPLPPEFHVSNFVYPPFVNFLGRGTPTVPPDIEFGRSDQPQPFARPSEGGAKARSTERKSKLDRGLRAFPALFEERKRNLTWAQSIKLPPPPNDHNLEAKKNFEAKKKEKEQNVQRAKDELTEAEKLERDYVGALALVDDFDHWMRHLKDMYQQLEDEVEIDFQLYLTVDGNETVILRSRSQPRDDSAATAERSPSSQTSRE